MKKLIKVTKKHIKNGEKYTATICPVALAVNEQAPLKGMTFAVSSSMGEYFKFIGPDLSNYISNEVKIPRSVSRFIKKFDNNKPVKPFNFILDIPEGV